ncbi:MAG: TlpA family protein disulfide reductase [Acidimicrobiales bacterium]
MALVAGLVTWVLTSQHQAVATITPGQLSQMATAGNPYNAPEVPKGKAAPGFSLPRLGGGQAVTSESFRGKPLVVNFFASWCPNCAKELGAFGAVSAQSSGKVGFVGIDTNDHAPATATSLLRKAGDRYPVGVDPQAALASRYLVAALPVTFFVSPSGRVVGEVYGAQTKADLLRWVHRLESS